MTGTQYWIGVVLAVVGALVIVVSIPNVGIAGIIGLENFIGYVVLGIAAALLAVGVLLVGSAGQEQPV